VAGRSPADHQRSSRSAGQPRFPHPDARHPPERRGAERSGESDPVAGSAPGQSIQTSEPEYVIPDVLVRKVSGRWVVELNSDSIPRLKINQQYAAMGNSARNDADSQFIRSNLQEARWLIKSLESRNDTLLRVSRCIVEQQQAFSNRVKSI
jgi:DNA-directed RNA polymerase specialized sigma54-like protein